MEGESQKRLDSSTLQCIVDYLSKLGFSKIAEDLKSQAGCRDESEIEVADLKSQAGCSNESVTDVEKDCFPHLPELDPSHTLLTKFLTPMTASAEDKLDVLCDPLRLHLTNMERRTTDHDVRRFFKASGVVPTSISLDKSVPQPSNSTDKPGCEMIETRTAVVRFKSLEQTKKALKLHGSFMEVQCKRTMYKKKRNAGIGRPVRMAIFMNSLRTVCVSGMKIEDGNMVQLDGASLGEIVGGETGVEVISRFVPENQIFAYFLVRVDQQIADHLSKNKGLLTIQRKDCDVKVRVVIIKDELLESIHGLNATRALEEYNQRNPQAN